MVLATGIFAGYWPLGPGTFGTVLALPLIFLVGNASLWLQIAFAGALLAVGVWASERAVHVLKRDDAPQIVIDEVVGYLVAMLAIPFSAYWLVWGFVLFRFFDIFKPFPISWLDRNIKGGWGVMADDLAAGLFANLVMHLMLRASL